MNDLKNKVSDLFELDRQINTLEKDLKKKTALFHHLVLKNSEKIYSDSEVLEIHGSMEEINALKAQKSALLARSQEIRDYFKALVANLGGGRWVHTTDDPIHPHMEFWMEEEELKYARLNGASYA